MIRQEKADAARLAKYEQRERERQAQLAAWQAQIQQSAAAVHAAVLNLASTLSP